MICGADQPIPLNAIAIPLSPTVMQKVAVGHDTALKASSVGLIV